MKPTGGVRRERGAAARNVTVFKSSLAWVAGTAPGALLLALIVLTAAAARRVPAGGA
jgi:hypothetical protein